MRSINLSRGLVTTVAGGLNGNVGFNNQGNIDGIGTMAALYNPWGIAMDPGGTFAIFADASNHAIRCVNVSSGLVTTVAGRGVFGFADRRGTSAALYFPSGVAMDSGGTFEVIADHSNSLLRRMSVVDLLSASQTSSGTSSPSLSQMQSASMTQSRSNTLSSSQTRSQHASTIIPACGVGEVAGAVTTVAGDTSGSVTSGSDNSGYSDGVGTDSLFFYPSGVALDATGSFAIIVDSDNNLVRQLNLNGGIVTTVAGSIHKGYSDGFGTTASFKFPSNVAMDSAGRFAIIVRDRGRRDGRCRGL